MLNQIQNKMKTQVNKQKVSVKKISVMFNDGLEITCPNVISMRFWLSCFALYAKFAKYAISLRVDDDDDLLQRVTEHYEMFHKAFGDLSENTEKE